MIRFINIGTQISLDARIRHFAFYNTITDSFMSWNGSATWETAEEFKSDYEGEHIERYLRLIPEMFK